MTSDSDSRSSYSRLAAMLILLLVNCQSVCADEFKPVEVTELFRRGEEYAKTGLWTQAIDCYKRVLITEAPNVYGFDNLVHIAVAHAPFNPDGHIALGLALQRKAESTSASAEHRTDYSQAELEFKQAITVSHGRKNREAEELLKRLVSLKKIPDGIVGNKKSSDDSKRWLAPIDRQMKVLSSRWKPRPQKAFFLSRVFVNYDHSSGDLKAVLAISSSNPEHDELAIQTCQSMIDDFPSMLWLGKTLQFVSQNGISWTNIDNSVSRGSTGYLAWAGFFDQKSDCKEKVDLAVDYLNHRWKLDRVIQYCRPDTRLPKCMQDNHRLLWLSNTEEGTFAFPFSTVFGSVNWKFAFLRGKPSKDCVYAKNGEWLLEYGSPRFGQYSEDDFLVHRIDDAVFLSIRKYELAHADDLGKDWIVRSKSKEPHESLVRDHKNKVVAYKCVLTDGAELTVNLNESLEIETILVNGKPDAAWNKAYREHDLSLSILDSQHASERG